MEHFKFKDIHTLASVVVIGAKSEEGVKQTAPEAFYALVKMIHPVAIHLHVDPKPREGPPPDAASFETLKKVFDYVFIYPCCDRIVFDKTLEYIGITGHDEKVTDFLAAEPVLPLVLCLNRMKPGAAIEVKVMTT